MAKSRLVKGVDLAEYLGLSSSTVYKMAADSEIPCYKLGRNLIFDLDEIDEWMTTRKKDVTTVVSYRKEGTHQKPPAVPWPDEKTQGSNGVPRSTGWQHRPDGVPRAQIWIDPGKLKLLMSITELILEDPQGIPLDSYDMEQLQKTHLTLKKSHKNFLEYCEKVGR
tara:strand:- start:588 stop:1085 length:498 start_codon:yes stop_codon:yes gene_type:complete